jgi:hypothetical protein
MRRALLRSRKGLPPRALLWNVQSGSTTRSRRAAAHGLHDVDLENVRDVVLAFGWFALCMAIASGSWLMAMFDVPPVLRQHFVHAGGGAAPAGEVVDADLVVVEGEAKLGRAVAVDLETADVLRGLAAVLAADAPLQRAVEERARVRVEAIQRTVVPKDVVAPGAVVAAREFLPCGERGGCVHLILTSST